MEVSNRVVTIADSQQYGYCGFNLIYYIIKCCAYYTKKVNTALRGVYLLLDLNNCYAISILR